MRKNLFGFGGSLGMGLAGIFLIIFTLKSTVTATPLPPSQHISTNPTTHFLTSPSPEKSLEIGLAYLPTHRAKLGLSEADLSELFLREQYSSQKSGMTHLFFRQSYAGIPVYNGDIQINLNRTGQIINLHNSFVPNLGQQLNRTTPILTAEQALDAGIQQLNQTPPSQLTVISTKATPNQQTIFAPDNFSLEPIPVQLIYQPLADGTVRLAWEMVIAPPSAEHWWSMRLDATTGELLSQVDWVIHDDWGMQIGVGEGTKREEMPANPPITRNLSPAYRVFAMPTENPLDGGRTLQSNPADAVASPYGWHDSDGVSGGEYTITRGNNVYAYEDSAGNNSIGYSPDGGTSLHFDFPLDLSQEPSTYWDAAISNLFYWNNVMHDVWYQYGFNEASGNFQQNSYGNGGLGNDYVRAEAQDGSFTNNASFSVPVDGVRPRMQMFVWSPAPVEMLTVHSPITVAGSYLTANATFGSIPPSAPAGISGNIILGDDGTASPTEGCSPLINGSAIAGNIALLDRGSCAFTVKAENAQNAGATALIVVNNRPHGISAMSGNNPTVTIPTLMISQTNGEMLKGQMNPPTVGALGITATLSNPGLGPHLDGDFDNGILAHEYGHGISLRLTGGPGNSNCLNNAEQGGEGWSDWFALMMTIEAGEDGTEPRGMGAYALGQSAGGFGIRDYPYSTDLSVDPRTYGYLATHSPSIPHGVGSVWAAMLWEMSWNLIADHGFDPDLYNGNAGNNLAMQLIIDGLKLQPCNAGFVSARDAILLAEENWSGGANQCTIWEAFAKRGLGASASQGDANDITDGVEAFDLPASSPNSVMIGESGGYSQLTWTATQAEQYQVWSSESPYFLPGSDCANPPAGQSCRVENGVTHLDDYHGNAGNPNQNIFYFVQGINGCDDGGENAGKVGEFDFTIVSGS